MTDQRVYLRDISERIQRIETFTAGGRETYIQSLLIQDGVIRNFEVIGEICKRLPPELTQQHPEIPWRQISGFRDVLIHDYEEVDIEAVWRIVENDLQPLKNAVMAMLRTLETGEDEAN